MTVWDHSEIEIHNKWVNIINSRLKLDKILTNSHRYGSKAIPKDKVLETWSGILYDEESLSDDWIRQSEVLVGIASWCPCGQNHWKLNQDGWVPHYLDGVCKSISSGWNSNYKSRWNSQNPNMLFGFDYVNCQTSLTFHQYI